MSAQSRAIARLVRRCADSAEWCMQEMARLRGELPGPAHYSSDQLEAWARGHAEMAFGLSAFYTGEPPSMARYAGTSLDPSSGLPGDLPPGRTPADDGSDISLSEESFR